MSWLRDLIPVFLVVGGLSLLWYINDSAYNRGVRDRDAEAAKIIASKVGAVVRDAERHFGKDPAELDHDLMRRCREAGGSDAECVQ